MFFKNKAASNSSSVPFWARKKTRGGVIAGAPVVTAVIPMLGSGVVQNAINGSVGLSEVVFMVIMIACFSICAFALYKTETANNELLESAAQEAKGLKREIKEMEECKSVLERENKMLRRSCSSVDAICSENAAVANSIIHDIIENGKTTIERSDFPNTCSKVCERIRQGLIDRFKEGVKCEVTYVQRDESTSELAVRIVGKDEKSRITNLNRLRKQGENSHYDITLFDDTADVVVVSDVDKLGNEFYRRPGSKKQYVQYIAAPVTCQRQNGLKTVGLLQVAVIDNPLQLNEKELEQLAITLLSPYCSLLLLVYKLRKSLVAKPQMTMEELVEVAING